MCWLIRWVLTILKLWRIYDHHISTQELSKVLALNDVEIVAIGKKAETLEDYFLKMTAEV